MNIGQDDSQSDFTSPPSCLQKCRTRRAVKVGSGAASGFIYYRHGGPGASETHLHKSALIGGASRQLLTPNWPITLFFSCVSLASERFYSFTLSFVPFFLVFRRLNSAALTHSHALAGPSLPYLPLPGPSFILPSIKRTVDTGFRRISFPSRVPTLVIFSLMKTMTQLAGTCQAYPRLHAAGKTRAASQGPVVACVAARVFVF